MQNQKVVIQDKESSITLYHKNNIILQTYQIECKEKKAIDYLQDEWNDDDLSSFTKLCELLEWDTIAIMLVDKKVVIGSSVGGSITYVMPKNNSVNLSKSEKSLTEYTNSMNQKVIKDAIKPSNRSLYSMSSFQEDKYFQNILCPGMIHIYKGQTCLSEFWHLEISNFAEDSYNEKKHMNAFCERLIGSLNEVIDNKYSLPQTLMLSSGIDSSVVAAAISNLDSNKKDSICCVNFRHNPYVHEAIQSEFMAKQLDLNFCGVPEYGLASITSNGNYSLNVSKKNWDALRGRTHMSQSVLNMDQAAVPFFGFHTSIGGTTGPTNLQIFHHLDYNKYSSLHKRDYLNNFEYLKNLRETFQCKIQYTLKIENSYLADKVNDLLGCYSYLATRVCNERFIGNKQKSSNLLIMRDDFLHYANLNFILYKISSSKMIQSLDKRNYNSTIAQKILKIFTFMLHHTRTQTGFRNYSIARQKSPCEPLLTSAIAKLFLSIRIDDTLTSDSKKLLFDAFKNLSGVSFEQLYKQSEILKEEAKNSSMRRRIDSELGRKHPMLNEDIINFILEKYNPLISAGFRSGLIEKDKFKEVLATTRGLKLVRYIDKIISTLSILPAHKEI
ncbi:hypothetical protein [Synechococcus sp. UW69]|uniref:hypothetical protein n=1 Tax=Synechococcus sp. UW69 TaxID=368493 RepID=UPI0010BDFB9B|nr:hypothetical protein [Synechococcus sp. UW69]